MTERSKEKEIFHVLGLFPKYAFQRLGKAQSRFPTWAAGTQIHGTAPATAQDVHQQEAGSQVEL